MDNLGMWIVLNIVSEVDLNRLTPKKDSKSWHTNIIDVFIELLDKETRGKK